MIAAIEGGAHAHSEYVLLGDVIVAGEGQPFRMLRTTPSVLRRVTASLSRGAIELEQDVPRRF